MSAAVRAVMQDNIPPEVGWPLAAALWLITYLYYRKDRRRG